MKIKTNSKLDVAYIQLRKGTIAQTIEVRPGVFMDLNKKGEVLGIEVMSLEQIAPMLDRQKRKINQKAA